MPIEYLTGSDPIWKIFDNADQFAYNGFLDTRSAINNNIPKLIYRDPAGLNPYPYPTRLTDLGRTPDQIYWENDEPYELRFLDQNYQLIPPIITPYFPNGTGGGGPPVTVTIDLFNHLLNPQFAFPLPIPAPLPATEFEFCRGSWFFHKSNTSATDSLSILPFILGQTDVPGQPKYYLEYLCTNVGAGGETFKDIILPLCNVIGFNDAEISLALWAKSPSSSAVQIIFRQFFGTGGAPSPTVDTVAGSINANAAWAQDTLTVTVPSIAGKNLGTNGDDKFYLIFRMPLNQLCDVQLACAQFVNGSEIPPFYHQTDDYIKGQIQARDIPFINPDGSQKGNAIIVDTNNQYALGYPGNQPFPFGETTIAGELILDNTFSLMPNTGTPPVITQGLELATVTITPASVASKIKIEIEILDYNYIGTGSSDVEIVLALFKTSQTNALRATLMKQLTTSNVASNITPIYMSLIDTPNTLLPVTYSARVGFTIARAVGAQFVINPNTGPNVGDVGALKLRAITISP